jgi:hypothetical protein
MRTYTNSRTRTQLCAHARTHARTGARAQLRTRAHARARAHARTHTRASPDMQIPARAHTLTRLRPHMRTHARTCAHTSMHACARTRIHSRTGALPAARALGLSYFDCGLDCWVDARAAIVQRCGPHCRVAGALGMYWPRTQLHSHSRRTRQCRWPNRLGWLLQEHAAGTCERQGRVRRGGQSASDRCRSIGARAALGDHPRRVGAAGRTDRRAREAEGCRPPPGEPPPRSPSDAPQRAVAAQPRTRARSTRPSGRVGCGSCRGPRNVSVRATRAMSACRVSSSKWATTSSIRTASGAAW